MTYNFIHFIFILRSSGINHPNGEEFLLPWWEETIGESQIEKGNTDIRSVVDAISYIEDSLVFPVYVKPVTGSKGIGVRRADNYEELEEAFSVLNDARSKVATVLSKGTATTLRDVSNLSAGGTSIDVSDEIDDVWTELSSRVASNFSLRLAGIDLACADISSPRSDYSVLEVNSSPGLDHYATSGKAQKEIVDNFYVKVLNAFPVEKH